MNLIVFATNKYNTVILNSINAILNSNLSIRDLDHKYHILKYECYQNILKELSLLKTKNIFEKITIIFLSPPTLSSQSIKNLREYYAIICCFGDISQYYYNYYKLSQFLFDGIIVFEPEYRAFFEVYGTKTYTGDFINHDIFWVLDFENHEINLNEFNKRKYDFSFVGRFDRSGRKESLNNICKYFPKTFIHDSSKEYLTVPELREITLNSKYFLNLTAGHKLDSYGINKFPERNLIQRKSRALAYSAAGCICFTERLPQDKYYFEDKNYLPLIEIPINEKTGRYCYEYITKNENLLVKKSIESRKSVYQTFSSDKIHSYLRFIHQDIWKSKSKLNLFGPNETRKIDNSHRFYVAISNFKREFQNFKVIHKEGIRNNLLLFLVFILKKPNYFKLFFIYILKKFISRISTLYL